MAKKKEFNIATSVHYEYARSFTDWEKYRYVMDGGDTFIQKYVKQFSSAEDETDFINRKSITPVAGFAKAAVKDVQNAIFQRMPAIRRNGGPESWQDAIRGQRGGVDLCGSTMNHFLGNEALLELLSMGKVGVYVDNFKFEGRRTRNQRGMEHPYLYTYRTEDIRNWDYFIKGDEVKLQRLLLRVYDEDRDHDFDLVTDYNEYFRLYWIEDNAVLLQQYNDTGDPVDENYEPSEFAPTELDTKEIPFVIMELQASLLADTANHQIALTNMESADAGYILRSNVPNYTEQYDQRFEAAANWSESDSLTTTDSDGNIIYDDNKVTRKIGSTDGVRYPMGAERPGYISPPTEPLHASMEKQTQLKNDIRSLSNLSVANTRSRFASAESKQMDERGLESGLSAIGMVLEHAERRIVEIWSDYEGFREESTVGYPERYSLRSDEDRRKDAEQLAKTAVDVSSHTFRREVHKEIVEILLAGKVADSTLDKMLAEVDKSDFPTADADQIRTDVEIGLVSREFASKARGYPEGEAKKAHEEKLDLEIRRAEAQAAKTAENLAARGLDTTDPQAAKDEKAASQDPEKNPDGKKLVRGKDKGQREVE